MKSILAVMTLALALSLCGLADRLMGKKTGADRTLASKEERVKRRLTELFNLCREGKNSEAASYLMYRGSDASRDRQDVARYTNEDDRRLVDDTCRGTKTLLDESNSYDFGKFSSLSKGGGSEEVALEVFFRRGADKEGLIYAFTLLDDKYVLLDIAPIVDEAASLSNSNVPPPPPQPKVGNVNTSNANSTRAPISGGVLNGKAISLPKPAYPAVAKAVRASGTVTVEVTVDEQGNVTSARAVSGHPLLKASAVSAARQAKFSPTKLAGQPVKVTGTLVYNFEAPS